MWWWSRGRFRDARGIATGAGGLKVAVLSKVFPTRFAYRRGAGRHRRIARNVSKDSWHWHMYDTVKGSDYLGDQDAIELLCARRAEVVYELEHYGMPFDRLDSGKIYQRPFGGHMQDYARRRCSAPARRRPHRPALPAHAVQQNVKANTHFFIEWMALDLIRDADGDVLGVTRWRSKPAK